MHALSALPPTLTVHVPQSPFLQFVFTGIPSFLQAAISEEFSPTITDLAPLVSFTCAIVAGRVRGAACVRKAGVPVSNADHATAGSSSSSSSRGSIRARLGFHEMSKFLRRRTRKAAITTAEIAHKFLAWRTLCDATAVHAPPTPPHTILHARRDFNQPATPLVCYWSAYTVPIAASIALICCLLASSLVSRLPRAHSCAHRSLPPRSPRAGPGASYGRWHKKAGGAGYQCRLPLEYY